MALFEVIDPRAGPAPPGLWEARPAPAASFGLGGEAGPQPPVWRVSLPADPLAARAELLAAEEALARQEQAVAAAPQRLSALAARRGAASFGAPADTPEARLADLMGRASAPRGASFGAPAPDDGELEAATRRFQSFAQQAQDAVANFAVVETRVERALVARTAVSWTGDMRSLLAAGALRDQAALHRRSLDLTMRSRAALLRTFATVLRGATLVAVMASSPAGALYALPAAWRFVDDLLREERARQQAPFPA